MTRLVSLDNKVFPLEEAAPKEGNSFLQELTSTEKGRYNEILIRFASPKVYPLTLDNINAGMNQS